MAGISSSALKGMNYPKTGSITAGKNYRTRNPEMAWATNGMTNDIGYMIHK